VPDNGNLSAGARPVIACHYYFMKGAHIIATITLTQIKHALINAGFSTKDSVQQGPGQSTPRHVSHLGGFAPPGKVFSRRTAHYSVMGHDGTYQGTLLPRPSAIVHRTV
jgi:hypothetical protein